MLTDPLEPDILTTVNVYSMSRIRSEPVSSSTKGAHLKMSKRKSVNSCCGTGDPNVGKEMSCNISFLNALNRDGFGTVRVSITFISIPGDKSLMHIINRASSICICRDLSLPDLITGIHGARDSISSCP